LGIPAEPPLVAPLARRGVLEVKPSPAADADVAATIGDHGLVRLEAFAAVATIWVVLGMGCVELVDKFLSIVPLATLAFFNRQVVECVERIASDASGRRRVAAHEAFEGDDTLRPVLRNPSSKTARRAR